jgi:protein phosphatase
VARVWVVKPVHVARHGPKGHIQPGRECQSREYLRIINDPDYTAAAAHLERLRSRNLGTKRSLALREIALGIEALDRLVREELLYKVHECVYRVFALESEPVDLRFQEAAGCHDPVAVVVSARNRIVPN